MSPTHLALRSVILSLTVKTVNFATIAVLLPSQNDWILVSSSAFEVSTPIVEKRGI